ncbi:MAG: biosynthetic arginine decarboxylase [Proteobacteria bacterium]|nr:biosynthetic arginine decarboxylase [Pseudomonadota bacterium]MBU1686412.1 biosynthetic arginine decarboxylase [Pseudomonadota bacterium]
MIQKDSLERWTIDHSADLYGIRNWGTGYFDINPKGDVIITPHKDQKSSISLPDIIAGIKDRGLEMPVLLRISNILDRQICLLHDCFDQAIKNFGYTGKFKGVYPIKVNQQQQVVEEITKFGDQFDHGLEAGSKAELLAAISFMTNPNACLICNGYKDEEYVDLGLSALKLGLKCFLVIEMPSELELILERAKIIGVRPRIGIRIKLATRAGGHWTESGGDNSIFGLNISQVTEAVDQLKKHGMLDCLQLLHYHLGSQIPNIRDIRNAVVEACQVYAGLVGEGAPMGYLNTGGGLAVDYDGSHANFINSRNYTLDEYCADIIETVMETMDSKEIPHPNIITESGRATVAYYSVLLFNILDFSTKTPMPIPAELPADTSEKIINMLEVHDSLSLKNIQECYNDATFYRDDIREMFKHGEISLRERALAETIFWHIIQKINEEIPKLKHVPKEFNGIESALADIYYGNFSVFQSVPDSWAIDQIFPVMPIHRLHEAPDRRAIIADITCDCDGKIDKFIDPHSMRSTLPVHHLKDGEEYYMGVFLVGAYQETLGDLHNLLGDTNVVTIRINEEGDYEFTRELEGDSVADVLTYVEYNPKSMIQRVRATAERAVRQGLITAQERTTVMKAYEAGLRGYTYFER